ncbi:hypothetical protein EDB87DRAFT_1711122 [Lactarius vividus]|nr:hypothetical protein EDB87DRAFT_1711122 [Lactarius vividus]
MSQYLIEPVRPSRIYGITWLQVYSYYNSHCSRDRWPLKFFVAFLMLIDSANLVFVVYTTYHVSVTNFGDYLSNAFNPLVWGQTATTLSATVRFYVELTKKLLLKRTKLLRVQDLSSSSPYLPAAIGLSIAALSCKVLCDILITFGMVYYFLSNRTQVRRTNNVLNLLAIYAINCGTLHLVFAVSCVTLLAKYRDTLVSTPSLFIMFRLSLCAFMAILNSRDNLRETLNGPEGVVSTLTQLKAHTGTTVPWGTQTTAAASTSAAAPKSRPPFSVNSDTSFSASVIAFDPVPPVPEVVTVMSGRYIKRFA